MKILFFGDSITESGRNPLDPGDLGAGYVKIAAGKLRLLYPEKSIEFVNRGIGGDTTEELLARVGEDVVAEKPDFVILYVGVNDVWHKFVYGKNITAEQFRANYERLVSEILGTGAKLFIVEPFVLKIGDKQRLRPLLTEFNAIIKEIAVWEKLPFVPLDEIFSGLTQDIAPTQFSTDGVHPTHRGCRYIADLIIKELKKELK